MLHQARLGAGDAGRSTRLAEVLAGKTGGDEIAWRQALKCRNVGVDLNVAKSRSEHGSSGIVNLAKEFGPMARLSEPDLNPSDTREQSDDIEASRLSLSGHGRKSIRQTGGRRTHVPCWGDKWDNMPHRFQPIST